MSQKIDQDHRRFREIVRGKIKQNLRKYISQGELIGRKGKDMVSIPLPQINVPRFRFGSKDKGGVGQGQGEVGDTLGKGDPGEDGPGKAGDHGPPDKAKGAPPEGKGGPPEGKGPGEKGGPPEGKGPGTEEGKPPQDEHGGKDKEGKDDDKEKGKDKDKGDDKDKDEDGHGKDSGESHGKGKK